MLHSYHYTYKSNLIKIEFVFLCYRDIITNQITYDSRLQYDAYDVLGV